MSSAQILRAAGLFFGTYGGFRVLSRLGPKGYPLCGLKVYTRKGRRVHHYETGLYLAAIGLALFLEDRKDIKLIEEFIEIVEDQFSKETKKRWSGPVYVRR